MAKTIRQIKQLYDQGHNISALLRQEKGFNYNSEEIIEIAYDMQTGTYIEAMKKDKMARHKEDYTSEIVKTIRSLCEPISILEAGVGEATTLSGVLHHFNNDIRSYGFDLSWSRIAFARRWLQCQGINNTKLCTGSLFHIPFAENSIDVVYTSHSIEPNGGYESQILRELFRVTRKYLILLEPGYELASDEAKRRMDSHGYCKNLKGTAENLGYNILEHKLFPFSANPLNPTAIIIIEKDECDEERSLDFVCPKFKTPLEMIGDMLYSPEALVVYPIVGSIPCLRIENGIFASKYKEIMNIRNNTNQ